MKLKRDKFELNEFLAAVHKAKGDVYLRSEMGDQYNLKSVFSTYIALGAMFDNKVDSLELFCADKSDEILFFQFFDKYPDAL